MEPLLDGTPRTNAAPFDSNALALSSFRHAKGKHLATTEIRGAHAANTDFIGIAPRRFRMFGQICLKNIGLYPAFFTYLCQQTFPSPVIENSTHGEAMLVRKTKEVIKWYEKRLRSRYICGGLSQVS